MNFIKVFTFTILAISFVGCQSDQSTQDKRTENLLNAKFYLRYLQTEKQLKTEVSFTTSNENNNFESVKMNRALLGGQKMQERRLSVPSTNFRYDFREIGAYRSKYQFEFQQEKFGTINKTISLGPINDINIPKALIEKSKGTRIEWQGEALNETQSLVLLFTSSDNQVATIEISGPTNDGSIDLDTNQLKALTVGENQLMLIKKQLQLEEENGLRSIIEIEFYANPVLVNVE